MLDGCLEYQVSGRARIRPREKRKSHLKEGNLPCRTPGVGAGLRRGLIRTSGQMPEDSQVEVGIPET